MESDNAQKTPEAPVIQKSSSSLYVVFKYFGIGMGIIGIGFLIALGGYLFAVNNQKKVVLTPTPVVQTLIPTTTPTVTPIASPSVTDTQIPNQKLYTNPAAGISFLFASKANGETYDVKQVGGKIYVFNTKYPYTQGQYLEIFQKSESDNLAKALEKQFLTNISPNDCFVKDAKPDSQANFLVNYEVKTLGYPVDPNSDAPFFAQSNKCPSPYAATNGISYFLGDTKHPKIFLFFSIGQYGIPSAPNSDKTWQDTIEFLN